MPAIASVTALDATRWLPFDELDRLLDALRADGRTIIGPVVRDDAIILDEIGSAADLPSGRGVETAPGRYRLTRRADAKRFDHAVGPMSPKRFTFPPRAPIRVGRRTASGVRFSNTDPHPAPLALIGVRACELAALGVQDRVLLDGQAIDSDYRARRAATFVVAVECATPTSTCFCPSMGTGPEVTSGFDVALTELDEGYVVRTGSAAGAALVGSLDLAVADPSALDAAAEVVAGARRAMGEPLDMSAAKDLAAAPHHPEWAAVAERCLGCTNCTLVCPTCFCTSVVQRSDLDGTTSTEERTWDSCFSDGFAKVAGGSFRPHGEDRYRQWLTHKFSTWWDQFGSSGCVGCGRCIAWCPVGIDVREELAVIAGVGPVPMPQLLTVAARAPAPVATAPALAAAPTPAPAVVPAPQPAAPALGGFVTVHVDGTTRETADTVTLHLRTSDRRLLGGRPGQFVMAALPAFSDAPISVSRFRPDGLDLTIRAAGPATRALTGLERGETLGLRGPLGRGWPVGETDWPRRRHRRGRHRARPAPAAHRRMPRPARHDRHGPAVPRRPVARRPALRRRGRPPRGRRRHRGRGDRRSRRTGLARAGRHRHPAVRPRDVGRPECGRIHLRSGTDDAGDVGRAVRARHRRRPDLGHARAEHGLRRRAVRALPARQVLRLQGRARCSASPSSDPHSRRRDSDVAVGSSDRATPTARRRRQVRLV